jgi:heme/copper-type cytochrome/quinol oxidase subunit 2
MKKIYIAIFMLSLLAPALMLAVPAHAQNIDLGTNYVTNEINFATGDPRTAAMSLVKLLMTFLGIIAVVIMLYGGFIWMTAAGNEDKVDQAKKLIAAGIIGLIIILAAFLIVNFVVTNVSNALNS